MRACLDTPEDAGAFEELIVWLARRLDSSSDLAELAATILGELPIPRRARCLDAAAARAGVAYGAAAIVSSSWVPSECWALAPDGSALFSASSSSAVLLHGEDLAVRLELELPDPEKFRLGPRAAGVDATGIVVARQLRVSSEVDGEPQEDFFLRFDRYDRAGRGWAMSLTHPNLLTEEVWVSPDLAGGVAADRGELISFDLRLHEATPGVVRRRPTPHVDVSPAGYLAPDRFLVVEDQGFFPTGSSRAVIWNPRTGEDVWVGPWQEDWSTLHAAPGSPWVLAGTSPQGGESIAWVLPAEDLAGPLPKSVRVPQWTTGRVSPCGRWIVGRGEQSWVWDRLHPEEAALFRLGRGVRIQDANDAGLVLAGWNQPQVLAPPSRASLRSPSAPAADGAMLSIDGEQVVLALRGDCVQRRWDRATGLCRAVFTDSPLALRDRVLHLAEKAEAATAVEVLDPATGEVLRRMRPEAEAGALAGIATGLAPVDLVAASADGRIVLAYRVLSGGLVTAFDVEAGEVLWEAEGHPVDDPLGPDGTVVLLGERERRQFPFRKVDLATGETVGELLLPAIGATVPRQAVDPATGASWLFHSSTVVRVDPGARTSEEVEWPGQTRALAFDPEGRYRARAIERRILVLEDQASGAEIQRWETEGGIDTALVFSEGALWAVVDGVVRRFELPLAM